ncbi:MAG: hypothetical protein HDS16_09020 [Bacteroides sp.]|nr:hypothetical protein [Bacteroides sp.]
MPRLGKVRINTQRCWDMACHVRENQITFPGRGTCHLREKSNNISQTWHATSLQRRVNFCAV